MAKMLREGELLRGELYGAQKLYLEAKEVAKKARQATREAEAKVKEKEEKIREAEIGLLEERKSAEDRLHLRENPNPNPKPNPEPDWRIFFIKERKSTPKSSSSSERRCSMR